MTGWGSGIVSARARCVLAPNASPMTLDGTNTWILAEPGSARAVVVDPGPDDVGHLLSVRDTVRAEGRDVGLVLLTHGHPDHAAGARAFGELAGAPVRALDPAFLLGAEGLNGGEVILLDRLEIRVVPTPGHSADSLSFLLPADGELLTGDTVLGRGSTVVAHPDGRLADYLESLDRLAALSAVGAVLRILPGHGPVLEDPARVVEEYRVHRRERLAQVEAAVAAGAIGAGEVVAAVYVDIDPALRPFAEMSVRAQLDYLAGR